MSGDRDDRLADELTAELEAITQRRLRLNDLMGLVIGLRPELAVTSDRYQRLAEVIQRLDERGLVAPSKGRVLMHGADLPKSVELSALMTRRRPEDPALRFPWVEEMRWAASGPRRSAVQHERLCRLSEWIAANRRRAPIPERERSLEIFEDDKLLGSLIDGILRGKTATLEALATHRCHPPMAVAPVVGAIGRTALVVENGTPFHSALAAARRHVAAGLPVDIAWIGYGAGEQLGAIIPSLTELRPAAISYFGDVDPRGLSFAAAGARRCQQVGLPPMQPAYWLYDALLDRGRPQHKRRPADWPEDGLAWLGDRLAAKLQHTLNHGDWLAHEWIGVEVLSTQTDWCVAPDR